MAKIKMFCLIIYIGFILLAACNLPGSGVVTVLPSTSLKASVNVVTDYHSGPGQTYTLLGTLRPEQEAEVVGRSLEGDYLVIRDPNNPAVLGWLPSGNAIVSGDPLGLPIILPPKISTPVGGCPSPVGGGPTPVSCPTEVSSSPSGSGCPSPVGGGPTPVTCPTEVSSSPSGSGCPSPVGGGPTPVTCPTGVGPSSSGSGCPSPVGGGPTPVTCPTGVGPSSSGSGCPSPVGGGPTPVTCSSGGGPPAEPTKVKKPTTVPGATPTPVK
jgi:hypothetical protein